MEPPREVDVDATFFRVGEWMMVEYAQELGAFLSSNFWFEYPFLTAIATYWKVAFGAIGATVRLRGARASLFGIFVMVGGGGVLSLVYLTLAMFALPLYLAMGHTVVPYDEDTIDVKVQADSFPGTWTDDGLGGWAEDGGAWIKVHRYGRFTEFVRSSATNMTYSAILAIGQLGPDDAIALCFEAESFEELEAAARKAGIQIAEIVSFSMPGGVTNRYLVGGAHESGLKPKKRCAISVRIGDALRLVRDAAKRYPLVLAYEF